MTVLLRIILVLCSLSTSAIMLRKIRQSKLQIEYIVFWVFFAVILIILSIFPDLAVWGSNALGIYSPPNFVFLIILFMMIIKIFLSSIEISNLEYRIKELAQKLAIDEAQSKNSHNKDTENESHTEKNAEK